MKKIFLLALLLVSANVFGANFNEPQFIKVAQEKEQCLDEDSGYYYNCKGNLVSHSDAKAWCEAEYYAINPLTSASTIRDCTKRVMKNGYYEVIDIIIVNPT